MDDARSDAGGACPRGVIGGPVRPVRWVSIGLVRHPKARREGPNAKLGPIGENWTAGPTSRRHGDDNFVR